MQPRGRDSFERQGPNPGRLGEPIRGGPAFARRIRSGFARGRRSRRTRTQDDQIGTRQHISGVCWHPGRVVIRRSAQTPWPIARNTNSARPWGEIPISDRPKAIRIKIAATTLKEIEERATARVERLEPSRHPSKVARSGELLIRNMRGLAGEQAVLTALTQMLGRGYVVRDAADAPDGPSDLEVTTPKGVLGVEVKTTTYGRWRKFGRAIPDDQLWMTDAAVYVWCAAADVRDMREIYIVGWSTTEDIRRNHSDQLYSGRPSFRQFTLPNAITKTPREFFPKYGIDDPEFDEFEWNQPSGQGSREALCDQNPADTSHVSAEVDPLSILLATQWLEGNEARPGFGPRKAIVRTNAAIRPLAELPDWINKWEPYA